MLAVTKSVPLGALSRVTGLCLSAFRSSIVKTKIKAFTAATQMKGK